MYAAILVLITSVLGCPATGKILSVCMPLIGVCMAWSTE